MPTDGTPPRAMLQVDGLHAYYGRAHILADVALAASAGDVLALLGRNGSGKTTLMRLLSGGLRPRTGELTVEGRPVTYDRTGLTRLRTTVQLEPPMACTASTSPWSTSRTEVSTRRA